MSPTLPELFHQALRSHSSTIALRFQEQGRWQSLTWGEVEQQVEAAAWLLRELPRGPQWRWKAENARVRLVVSLALLHLGVVGQEGEGTEVQHLGENAPRGFLTRLRNELRPRDGAWGRLDQAQVAGLAQQRAPFFEGREVLVSAAEEEAGFAGASCGGSLVIGGPALLPTVAPAGWLCDRAQLQSLGLPRSRAGTFGRYLRSMGRAESLLGTKLMEVQVVGEIPDEAQALADRGVQLRRWGI